MKNHEFSLPEESSPLCIEYTEGDISVVGTAAVLGTDTEGLNDKDGGKIRVWYVPPTDAAESVV